METNTTLKACAGLPGGAADLDYSPLSEASEQLRGKRITCVESTGHNTLRVVLDDGSSVSFTPSGIEGDDIDLMIHGAGGGNTDV